MQNKKILLDNPLPAKDVFTNEDITLTKIRLAYVRIFPNKSQILIGYDFVSDANIIGKHKELSITNENYLNLDPSEDNILKYIINNDDEAKGTITT